MHYSLSTIITMCSIVLQQERMMYTHSLGIIALLSNPKQELSPEDLPRKRVSVEGLIKRLSLTQPVNKCFIIQMSFKDNLIKL